MARFVKNPRGEAELARDPAVAAHLALAARQVKTETERGAPRQSGAYARSIRADGTTVYSTDPFAHLIEWGSAKNPPYAPMRRGVQAAGLRLDESR